MCAQTLSSNLLATKREIYWIMVFNHLLLYKKKVLCLGNCLFV